MSQYSVHKLWFYYTDEWYITNDELGSCIGVFDTYDEALKAKIEADRKSLRNLDSYNWLRDLMGFNDNAMGGNLFEHQLLEYAKSQDWEEYIVTKYGYQDRIYHELQPPDEITDEQLDHILAIAYASFHRIVEYKNVKELACVKLNRDFWDRKVFEEISFDGSLEGKSTPELGYYLLYAAPEGEKTVNFPDLQLAMNAGLEYAYKLIQEFKRSNYLGENYLEDATSNFDMMKAYLKNCKSIVLIEELVTFDNQTRIHEHLRKMKSVVQKTPGDTFYSLNFNEYEDLDKNELSGFFELLKIKPFKVYRVPLEINGELIKNLEDHDAGML